MLPPENALREMYGTLWSVLGSLHFGVMVMDPDGKIRSVNRAALDMLGYSAEEELSGKRCAGTVCPSDGMRCPLGSGAGSAFHEGPMLHAAGGRLHALKSSGVVTLGGEERIVDVFIDVTGYRRTRESLALLEKAARTTRTGMTICNTDGTILYTNPADAEMHGYAPEELIGKNVAVFAPEGKMKPLMLDQLKEIKTWTREGYNARKDGSVFPVRLISDVVLNESGDPVGIVTTCEDITERKLAEKRLIESRQHLFHLAHHDALTGLPNRIFFNDRLMRSLSQARRYGHVLAVMLFDVDHFKTVNDTLGHSAGDLLLQQIAERLTDSLRDSDIIARLGGDEFCIILPEVCHPEDVDLVARKILRVLETPFIIEGRELYATISMGISLSPKDGDDPAALLKNADSALYQAKAQGRNNYKAFRPEMNERSCMKMEFGARLKRALERGEFSLYYQPQVSTKTGRIQCMEALIRWMDPNEGMVSPLSFIPVAEETGLIIPIGDWVLRTACAQAKKWGDAGRPVQVAVNFSAQQFLQPDIAGGVSRALRDTGLPPERLEIEITESAMMQNLKGVQGVLKEMGGLGVRVAVDDFGIGYSSLNYLRKFPIHCLKIDRTFVSDIAMEADDSAIASAIIALGKSLGLDVVAEGVETVGQLEFLRARGCDRIQGYLFAPPLPAEEAWTRLMEDI